MNRTAEIIREIYRLVEELEAIYPGRKFTPDGHLVGSIGEAYAAERYGLKLLAASSSTHDAVDVDGRYYQIKATGGSSIGIRSCPDNLLVLKLHRDGTLTEIYRGPGQPAWNAAGAMQKNGQRAISLSKLRMLIEVGK
jgi:hypothetical protein